MTVVVILFLVVLWAIVLGPTLYRRWNEGRVSGSIGAFHHHLGVLRRAGPGTLVSPANVLDSDVPMRVSAPQLPPPIRSVPAVRLLKADGTLEIQQPGTSGSSDGYMYPAEIGYPRNGVGTYPISRELDGGFLQMGRRAVSRNASVNRAATLKRRREAVAVMAGSFGACFIFGMIPALRIFMYLGVFPLVAMVGYVALLVRFERLAQERRVKISPLNSRLAGAESVTLAKNQGDYPGISTAWPSVASGLHLRRSHYVYAMAGDEEESVVTYEADYDYPAVAGGRA